MSLEICVWKECEMNPDSTTFSDVKTYGKEHPLYKCIECDGFDKKCHDYRALKYQRIDDFNVEYNKW